MTSPLAYESRACFCLWSIGDVKDAIRDNHRTVLYPFWVKEHFYIEKEPGSEVKKFSFCRLLWSLGAYPIGMISYFVDTLLKVVLTVGNLFVFVVALICRNEEWKRDRRIILLDSLAALGIAIIGSVVPPLAYHLDGLVKCKMLAWADPNLDVSRSELLG